MPSTLSAPVASDMDILTNAIKLEDQAIWTYKAAAGTKLLSAANLAIALKIVAQHQMHHDKLADVVTKMGGSVPAPLATYPLPDIKGEGDIAKYALKLETIAVNAYFDAFTKLSDAGLKLAGVSIMNDEAQHVAIWRNVLGMSPVDSSFLPFPDVM